jgi:dihydrofolate reductase
MRKLIYTINLSIDGCCDHTKLGMPPDDDLFEYCIQLVQDADLLIYGRKCYQIMVPYWPDILKNPSGETQSDIDYAQAFESTDKVVFSKTLDKAEGKNTRIVRTDLQEEIVKLKQEQGKDMLVGGVELASELMALGLVDEFRFVVMPVIVGGGKRLMEGIDLPENLQLKLVESKTFKSGCVLLRYVKQ